MELKCHRNYIEMYRFTKEGEKGGCFCITLHDHVVVPFVLLCEIRTALTLVQLSVYFSVS